MSVKWLEREGRHWVEDNVITREQYDQLVARYRGRQDGVGVLPVLGSILVGLGILSFIAANWQEIDEWIRLAIIIVAMCGFYGAGHRFIEKGHEKLGIAIAGIGLLTFGGGIVLVGQMFHLVAHNAASFMVWGVAGTLLTFLYRSRYLFMLSLVIFLIAQIYSMENFNVFSYTDFILMAAGLGTYAWQRRDALLDWLITLAVTIQSLILVGEHDWKFAWFYIPLLILYAAGDFVSSRGRRSALQTVPLIAGFIIGVVLVFIGDLSSDWWGTNHFRPDAAVYLPVLIGLLLVSAYGKYRSRSGASAAEWLLFLPLFYTAIGTGLLYLLALFLFSLYVLWIGYAEHEMAKINTGTVLFIVTTMIAYGKLTWDFMDKSMFFIIGGLILLALSWFLNRRRKQFQDGAKEG